MSVPSDVFTIKVSTQTDQLISRSEVNGFNHFAEMHEWVRFVRYHLVRHIRWRGSNPLWQGTHLLLHASCPCDV